MQWFLAKIVFRIITPQQGSSGQFEEKLRLVQAGSRVDALRKATAWGESENADFVNQSGKKISWQFIAVSELRLLPEIADGLELDSHLEERPEAEEFISLQRDKHQKLFLSTIE